jgi:PhzF family phenazine biosynthesis protein
MSFEMILVDAFSDTPFAGNPAAVCLLTETRSQAWMLALAQEMNLSETVYVTACDDGAWALRYFTPTQEIELCGHATFASAHVIFERGMAQSAQLVLRPNLCGELLAMREGRDIAIDFPSLPARPQALPEGVAEALGVTPMWTGRNHLKWLVEVEEAATLRAMTPDFGFIRSLPDCEGVVVTARSDAPDVDFESRFFAGPAGVDEDPVCGSAHCMLTPYWADKLGTTELKAYQCSARGGSIRCQLEGERVGLIAPCVTVSQGRLSDRASLDVGVEQGTLI